ncbi:MAG: hypothetical protein AAF862_01975 [Pseudomonadota bacterium]
MNTRKTLPEFEAIFLAAADHIAAVGAQHFSVNEIAESLNVTPDMLQPLFNDLYSFSASFGRFIDGAVLREKGDEFADSDEPARDRLFDVIMARFDALLPYKAAVQELGVALRRDPKLSALVVSSLLPNSMSVLLSVSNTAVEGRKKRLQVAGLTLLWLRVSTVWGKDDSEDMSKTMSALDKELIRADRIAKRLF